MFTIIFLAGPGLFTFLFLVAFFILYGCYKLFTGIGNSMFPGDRGYTDRSVHHHHHYHDNRSIRINDEEFKKLKK